MTKKQVNKKTLKKVKKKKFNSLNEIKKDFFPKLFEKQLANKKAVHEENYGTGLTSDILDNFKSQLNSINHLID